MGLFFAFAASVGSGRAVRGNGGVGSVIHLGRGRVAHLTDQIEHDAGGEATLASPLRTHVGGSQDVRWIRMGRRPKHRQHAFRTLSAASTITSTICPNGSKSKTHSLGSHLAMWAVTVRITAEWRGAAPTWTGGRTRPTQT